MRFPIIARLAVAGLCAMHLHGAAVPTTFGPVIGSALLCRSHLDNRYFHDYLTRAFGPSYKREGGAYWFKSDAKLWGVQVTDVLVSDDSSTITFVAAVADTPADKLEQSIRTMAGARHRPLDRSGTPVRESAPGSRIVYFNTKSKIFCAKYRQPRSAQAGLKPLGLTP